MSRLLIGAAAEQVGVSTSALRRWEREGLVRPSRSRSGYRLYSDGDVRRLHDVRRIRQVSGVAHPSLQRILLRCHGAGTAGTMPVGALRAARQRSGLALRDAADRSGISASHLSAIERGAANPSVATLQRLTSVYGTTLHALTAAEEARRVVRADARRATALAEGVRIEHLAVGARRLEPQLFILEPAASSDGAYTHEGEEFLYVLSGAITIWIGGAERHELATGDALTFPSTLPHRWRSTASGETRLLWINTPPTF